MCFFHLEVSIVPQALLSYSPTSTVACCCEWYPCPGAFDVRKSTAATLDFRETEGNEVDISVLRLSSAWSGLHSFTKRNLFSTFKFNLLAAKMCPHRQSTSWCESIGKNLTQETAVPRQGARPLTQISRAWEGTSELGSGVKDLDREFLTQLSCLPLDFHLPARSDAKVTVWFCRLS